MKLRSHETASAQAIRALRDRRLSPADEAAWRQFSVEWAKRLLAAAEDASGSGRALALDVADRACKEARGRQPDPYAPLPRWFAARLRQVVVVSEPRDGALRRLNEALLGGSLARWCDHCGVVTVDGVRCFVSEPYPWFATSWTAKSAVARDSQAYGSAAARWAHVVGDFADLAPADEHLAEAADLARQTGCQLLVERVAWWHPHCFRMTFVPLDPSLASADATQLNGRQEAVQGTASARPHARDG